LTLSDRGLFWGLFSLSPGAIFLGALLFYLGPTPAQAACLAAAALHEGGHLLACAGLGVEVRRLRLTALGAVLDTDVRCGSGREELLVALAGPAVNLCSVPAGLWGHRRLFAGASLLLGLFNLLPVVPLDGSRALHGLLSLGGGLDRAEEWTICVSRWGGGMLLALGVLLGALGNRSLLLVAVWMALRGRRNERETVAKNRKERGIWGRFSGGLCP
jgi:Zn-dependent protease